MSDDGERTPDQVDAEGLAVFICTEAVKDLPPLQAHRVARYIDERFFHDPIRTMLRQMAAADHREAP